MLLTPVTLTSIHFRLEPLIAARVRGLRTPACIRYISRYSPRHWVLKPTCGPG